MNLDFLRNNLSLIKNGAYVINLDNKKSKGRHCVSLFIDRNTAVYLYSCIPEKVLKLNQR